MVHMGGANLIDVNFIALDGLQFIWTGVAAHAASAPEQGRNALNAARLFMDATDMMRQHIIQDARIHRIIKAGGMASNIVPDRAEVEFLTRAPKRSQLNDITQCVKDCSKAAAMATRTQVEFHPVGEAYHELYVSPSGRQVMKECYPNVLNCYFADMAPEAQDMSGKLNCYTKERYGQEYDREYFYTGICDLSYINIEDPEEQRKRISQSMPLFGWYYDIPFEEIKKISMAGINIGPWGKDFHKLTERVLMENLYDRTPHILDHAITILLG